MSNHSEFMILVGSGHPYGGEGILVNDTLSLHMKKGGWFFDTGDYATYWPHSSVENAFLMISLYFVAPHVEDESPFAKLRRNAETAFTVSLAEHGIDTHNPSHITKEALQSLYDENKSVLSQSNVKFVGIRLGASILRGMSEDPLREEFLETVQRYDLHNIEYCETIYGRFWGSFSQQPNEYRGTIVRCEPEDAGDEEK